MGVLKESFHSVSTVRPRRDQVEWGVCRADAYPKKF